MYHKRQILQILQNHNSFFKIKLKIFIDSSPALRKFTCPKIVKI